MYVWKRTRGLIIADKGRLSGFFYELSVKTLMCFWWLNYEIYATIYPLDYWLVSFLICVNYSVGIFIFCLMFLCLKCLLTMGETQYCFYSVGLWFICYASQSFKCSWFSVCCGLMNVCPLVFKLYNQNPKIPILLNWVYWDYVGLFFYSLRTNFGSNRIH